MSSHGCWSYLGQLQVRQERIHRSYRCSQNDAINRNIHKEVCERNQRKEFTVCKLVQVFWKLVVPDFSHSFIYAHSYFVRIKQQQQQCFQHFCRLRSHQCSVKERGKTLLSYLQHWHCVSCAFYPTIMWNLQCLNLQFSIIWQMTLQLPDLHAGMKNGFRTWSDLDEPVVLNEDGVTGQVAMDDGWATWVEITGWHPKETNTDIVLRRSFAVRHLIKSESETNLRADRICVHHLFQACKTI